MPNDQTLPSTVDTAAATTAIALVPTAAPDRHTLPAAVQAAARLVTVWADQPMFTMSDDQAGSIAAAIENARQDLAAMFLPTDPRDVVEFMVRLATRRSFQLPPATDLVADAMAVSTKLPADLFHLASQRLWTDFAYRRLPEPSDFTRAVKDALDSRTNVRAKIERMDKALAGRRQLAEKVAAHSRHHTRQ